jgi:hypothetical protein
VRALLTIASRSQILDGSPIAKGVKRRRRSAVMKPPSVGFGVRRRP